MLHRKDTKFFSLSNGCNDFTVWILLSQFRERRNWGTASSSPLVQFLGSLVFYFSIIFPYLFSWHASSTDLLWAFELTIWHPFQYSVNAAITVIAFYFRWTIHVCMYNNMSNNIIMSPTTLLSKEKSKTSDFRHILSLFFRKTILKLSSFFYMVISIWCLPKHYFLK